MPVAVKALVLVAAPFAAGDFEAEDGGDFAFATSRVGELQSETKNIVIMHSKDDFVVPYEHGLQYHKALPAAEFISFADKNHFLVEEFPELLEKLRSFR